MNELALFAGAGGGILGGVLLGWNCIGAVEIEKYPRKVLLARQCDGLLPEFPIWDDVRTFDGKPWRGLVDVVSGGFPCQDISCAGKGIGINGERSGLWAEMHRIICEVRPRFAFMENSPMLTSRGLGRVLGDLAEAGYNACWTCLSASDCGAPHRRERIWILTHDADTASCGLQADEVHDRNACQAEESPAGTTRNCLWHGIQDASYPDMPGREKQRVSKSNEEEKSCLELRGQNVPDTVQQRQGWNTRAGKMGPHHAGNAWWQSEPRLGRMADGVAARVDRLKSLGNGQVPIVAATAFRMLYKQLTGKEYRP